MESESATIHRKMRAPPRQLPITGFAHKAAVVGDGRVGTGVVLAAHDVPAEGRRATALDRAHHLELAEAHVTAVGVTPSGPVVAEDIYCLLCQSLFGRYSRLNMIPSWSEWIERAAVLASVKERPGSVGASRTVRVPAVLDSRSTRRRRASIPESFNGYVDVPSSD